MLPTDKFLSFRILRATGYSPSHNAFDGDELSGQGHDNAPWLWRCACVMRVL